MISNKQKRALEKGTGKPWNVWHPEAIKAYFAFTDRGQRIEVPTAKEDFDELMICHIQHPIIVELWKKDFRKGLLFLSDFLNQDHPEAYVRHAFDIYLQAMGYIPKCYMEIASKLGIKRSEAKC